MFWRRPRRRPTRDRALCITHSPGDWCEPGQTWTDGAGAEFVITRLVQLSPTRLRGGGTHPCWQLHGRPVDEV